MENINQLFEHELEDIYYAEHKLVPALQEMASESTDPAVKKAFLGHMTQTEQHIKRLDQVFDGLGMKPKAEKCLGIEGLLNEKKAFAKEKPSQEVLQFFNLGAGAKSERYEISAYEGLIAMATELGMNDARKLLSENLQEEEHALSTVKNLSKAALQHSAAASAKS
jgi:ferritin-like metal-binding protein YciE